MQTRNYAIDLIIWLLISAVGTMAIGFLGGVDTRMDEMDAAHKLAAYCQDAPMSMLCVGGKHE